MLLTIWIIQVEVYVGRERVREREIAAGIVYSERVKLLTIKTLCRHDKGTKKAL